MEKRKASFGKRTELVVGCWCGHLLIDVLKNSGSDELLLPRSPLFTQNTKPAALSSQPKHYSNCRSYSLSSPTSSSSEAFQIPKRLKPFLFENLKFYRKTPMSLKRALQPTFRRQNRVATMLFKAIPPCPLLRTCCSRSSNISIPTFPFPGIRGKDCNCRSPRAFAAELPF